MPLNWYRTWQHAIYQAHRRAWLTGRRYRVHYDAANQWWNLTELTEQVTPCR